MESLMDPLISLVILTAFEIVLGIDNLIFLSICVDRLPLHQQTQARRIGLFFAWLARLLLLAFAVSLSHMTTPLFTVNGIALSTRDLFFSIGGLFLFAKAIQEIHYELEQASQPKKREYSTFGLVVFQIVIFDILFSLDSVLTAVGLTANYWIMVIAISLAMISMLLLSRYLSHFIERHPTIKMLAFSFLILIGFVLVADGFHFHIPRGYVYFSIFFAIFVEALNVFRKRSLQKK